MRGASGDGPAEGIPENTAMAISADDLELLRRAKQVLEHPSLAARITSALGVPIEKGMSLLPEKWSDTVRNATRKALETALKIAVGTLESRVGRQSDDFVHKLAVVVTGAGGGAFGLAALAVELPVSTTIMLRSIADIAQSQGEDLNEIGSRLACLEVFALGGRSPGDNSSETGYFAVRAALAKAVSEAAEYIAERGLAKEGAPPLIRLTVLIAERFGVQVSEKAATQAVPVVGAAGGALINMIFMDHFQSMARAHFTARRLERKYGAETVKTEYDRITTEDGGMR